jgi:hypothetical protein
MAQSELVAVGFEGQQVTGLAGEHGAELGQGFKADPPSPFPTSAG